VRLSSGISTNILDFSIPQKHVLTVMKAQETARKASGGEVQACQGRQARHGTPGQIEILRRFRQREARR
jgi:hypothetical protein